MSFARSIAQNISYVMIARAGFRFLTALAMVYALRYFGPQRYGMLETAIAWSNAVMTLSDIGMSTLIVREASRDAQKAGVYFGNTLVVQTIMSAVILLGLIAMGFAAGYDPMVIVLIGIIGAGGLIFEFRKVMRGILRVVLEMRFISILEVANGALFFGAILCLFFFVTSRETALLGFAIAQLVLNALSVIALFIYTLRFAKPHVDLGQIPTMLRASWTFTLYNIFFMLYFQVDQILLSLLSTPEAVGYYSAPAKVASVLLFVPMMVYQITLPLMYRYSKSNPEKYQKITTLTYRYFAAFGVPAGIGLILLAEPIVRMLFGEAYSASVPVMQWMGAFLVVRFLSISVSNILTTSDKQGLLAGIQVASVVCNIILDLVLIPRYGFVGPAIATFITECCASVVYLLATRRLVGGDVKGLVLPLIPISFATAAMTGVVVLAQPLFHAIVVVILGMVCYSLFLLIFRFFTEDDRKLARSIFNKSSI